jgi:membrane-associated phospholipid phosphatase
MMDVVLVDSERRVMPRWVLVVLWIGAIVVAMTLDSTVSQAIRERAPAGRIGILDKDGTVASIIRAPGVFYTTLVIAVALSLVHPWKWRAGGLLCLSGVVAGLGYVFIKWVVGRMRPEYGKPYEFDFFKGGFRSLFEAPAGLSFPSGHTALAFATAAVLALCYPKFRWGFYALAACVGIGRVLENTHFPSDVIAAGGLGILSRNLTLRAVGLFMPQRDAHD